MRRPRLLSRGSAALLLAWALCAALPALAAAPAPPAHRPATRPARAAIIDPGQWIDANRLRMLVTNVGSIAYTRGPDAGLEYPRGSGRFVGYAGGLWLGARLPGGEARATVADYEPEFGPGAILPGGASDDHAKPAYKVYRLQRRYPDVVARDAALADWTLGAVPQGAPPVALLADGTLGIAGDQLLWCVYNDADPALHTSSAGGSPPLGLEVRQAVLAFDHPGAAGDAILLEYQIRNRGALALDSLVADVWLDADLGGGADDMMGCDPGRALGFVYNADDSDEVYGATPPAVGVLLLRGPAAAPGGTRLGASAIMGYIGGADPQGAAQSLALLQGRYVDGSPVVDPTTSQVTTFMRPGDPVTHAGWLDTVATDKRVMVSSGPFRLAPGDTAEMLAAIVVGQGADRLASISVLRASADAVRAQFAGLASLVNDSLPPAAPAFAVRVSPNPARATAAIEIRLAPSAPARIDLFDVHGRRVRTQQAPGAAFGPTAARIDLRDLEAGLYFVRVRQGGREATARFVLAP